ncbi:isocitrate lyase/phosphoenolpyruvate mutase family protein, partial [Mycobacterium sp.]|uniref:isocitrate lyase/phosphoenolpyruvate mutase family protein n=1 Tax=Mycobacterium sp. TaxID=1785 RepID=UPI003BB13CE3
MASRLRLQAPEKSSVCSKPVKTLLNPKKCRTGPDRSMVALNIRERNSWDCGSFRAPPKNTGGLMTPTRKSARLRQMLNSDELEFILEAHNGISAVIAEEAGFKGIWASSFTLSAQFGVRDNNETSWTQVVDMVEFMADATSVPIVLDGDTGYGNFNNTRRLVRK